MSFKRFTPSDFLVSADSVTAPCWTNNVYDLTTFFTSSTQENSSQGDYVLVVYQTSSTLDIAAIQFYIGYANQLGSGSTPYNSQILQYSPSSTLYGQWRNLILEDENSNFIFGNVTQSQFYILSVERANYKQSLLPGSLNLTLRSGSRTLNLTDDSNMISVVPYINGTRVYQLISGSNGIAYTGLQANGYTSTSGSYGWFVPDMGAILVNSIALEQPAISGGLGMTTLNDGSSVANGANNTALFSIVKSGSSFELNSQ